MTRWYESADAIVFGTPAACCTVCWVANPGYGMAALTALLWGLFAGGLVWRFRREKREKRLPEKRA